MSTFRISRKNAIKTLAGAAAFAAVAEPEIAPATWPAVGRPATIQIVLGQLSTKAFKKNKNGRVQGGSTTIHIPKEEGWHHRERFLCPDSWEDFVDILKGMIATIESRDEKFDQEWKWIAGPHDPRCDTRAAEHKE
ncbi:MAG TPA: hypothetical protein VIG51_12470 [Candidatus Baltobacteraceae bacterium]|jgi:hypothetical protein